jgi:aspartate aminotransferase
MSIIAKHIAGVRGSEMKAMTARAAALRSQGRSIVTLSQGEPDFETPSHVRAAAYRAIDEGKTRYTAVAGIQALRESIVAKLERDNNLHFTTGQVTVGCGAKQVIFNAWLASLDPGDEVIIPTPLDDAGVAVVPGSGFLGSPFFRVSFAAATEQVMEGCSRIAAACERLVPGAQQ